MEVKTPAAGEPPNPPHVDILLEAYAAGWDDRGLRRFRSDTWGGAFEEYERGWKDATEAREVALARARARHPNSLVG